jgi:hypothetical protein
MRKTVILPILFMTIACGLAEDMHKKGQFNNIEGEYNKSTQCVTITWESVYDASKYKIIRSGGGYSGEITKETTDLFFVNCANDADGWGFDVNSTYGLHYDLEAYIEGIYGVGHKWKHMDNYWVTPYYE